MHWNYRMIMFKTPQESYYAIHEVHYGDDGKPVAYAENPATALWDVEEGEEIGAGILAMMTLACGKPVLLASDFGVAE